MNGGGGPDGLDNDNNYDDVSKPQFLPADHPLYKRVQAAFHKQLGDEFERAHLDYKDKSNTLRAVEKDKEEVGVQVYGLQQQLADMQQAFEAVRDLCNNIFKTREENESKRASLGETLEFRKSEISDLRKKVERANTELSKLNFGLHSMKSHKEDLKSELKLTQRRTHRTEENIVNLEKEKREQDFLVDQMNEEIKRLSKRISDLDSQTIAQRGETEEAMMIMKEADDEMENIRTSIRNLMSHWKKAVFEIEEKDKNLLKLKEAVEMDDEKNVKIASEIAGIEKNIREEQETQTVLGEKLAVNKNILSHYNTQIKNIKEDREKTSAQNAYLKEALEKTKESMVMLEGQRDSLLKEITKIEKNIMELHTETRLKQEEVINKVSSHKTISKTTINLKKLMSIKENELEEKQIELAREDNMVARINIDIMNTQNQLRQVEELKKEVNQERAAHEAKVDENEKKIKSNHEHHEKQMHDIAKFNREHDKAMQKQSIFSKGPSDAKHMHLKKETEEMQAQAKKAQGEFIKEQTIIVKREFYSNSLQEEISELKRKEIILEQKRLRLTNQLNQHKKEIDRIGTSLKNFQNDMNKLNEYLAENYEKAKDLQNENINIDSEIAQKLKELEKEAIALEVRIDRMKEEKAELLQQIVEAERQKLLWERKIALEKEMQEKLNPNYGQADIEQLKKKITQIDNQIRENVSEGKPNTELLKRKIQLEKDLQERQNLSSGNTGIEQLKKKIHLMELDLNGVKRDQDEITLEMERIIKKKVSIQLKYSKGQTNNPAKITKEVQSLQDVLARSNKGLKELDNNLRAKNNDLQNLRANLAKLEGAEMDVDTRHDQIIEKKIERLSLVVETAGLQKRTKALEDISATGIKRASESQKNQLRQINDENNRLQQALKMFIADNPRFGPVLNKLIEIELEGRLPLRQTQINKHNEHGGSEPRESDCQVLPAEEGARRTGKEDQGGMKVEEIRTETHKNEDFLKNINTSGETIGEILKYDSEKDRFMVKGSNGQRYLVGYQLKLNKSKLVVGTRVTLDITTLTIMRILEREVDPLVHKMLTEDPGNVSYDEIGGLYDQIRVLRETIELPITNPELFKRVGIKPPKGVLLYGPPGTGKTLLARALASNVKSNFMKVVASGIVDKYIGESARVVREMFAYAKSHQPCIIFIDEIDAIGGRRFSQGSSSDREIQRTLMELLGQLDGFDEIGQVKTIMATNRPDVLDPALLRPGRLDRKVEIPLPNEASRVDILKIHAKRISKYGSIDYDSVAKICEDFNGADLRNVCTEAGMFAIRDDRDLVHEEDFLKAARKIKEQKKLESKLEYSKI